ncbi:hypothetical protein [[Clostridium] innocuum]|uniref:hypothetical protein n=1 Tax=Clostridium innocuum TaxID=1522 RepID=UPI0022E7D107|nr:hypothetical protein [[Clostridium] innocuum]
MINEFKSYRNKELKYFVLSNLLIVLLLNDTLEFLLNLNFNTSIFEIIQLVFTGSFLYLFVFVLDSLIPISLKSKMLLYFRIKKEYKFFQMPGEYIFTKLKNGSKDLRINKERVMNRYKFIYEKMPENDYKRREYENHNWYSLYRKHEKKGRIETAQKEYLLCRDMVSSFCVFALIYMILFCIGLVNLTHYIFGYFVCMYIILLICSRNKANRYIINVIVEDIYQDES